MKPAEYIARYGLDAFHQAFHNSAAKRMAIYDSLPKQVRLALQEAHTPSAHIKALDMAHKAGKSVKFMLNLIAKHDAKTTAHITSEFTGELSVGEIV